MSDVKWIKISTSIFDDEKIQLIEAMPDADTVLVIWLKLLVQAGKVNHAGEIHMEEGIPYTDEMLSTIFRRPLNSVRLALQIFQKFKMIEIVDGNIGIVNWNKHQNVDGMEKIKEQWKLASWKYRNKDKQLELPEGRHMTSYDRHKIDIDIDKELEKEGEEDKRKNNNFLQKKVNFKNTGNAERFNNDFTKQHVFDGAEALEHFKKQKELNKDSDE